MIHFTKLETWPLFLGCMLLLMRTGCAVVEVNITLAHSAVNKGAVCLDGSPPAYYFDKGFGSGVDNWLIKLGGGSWCPTVTRCIGRANSSYGSSDKMNRTIMFNGILNNLEEYNPDFYNWNRVRVQYCDGSSFTGDIEEVVDVHPIIKLHFRGARIIPAIVEELLAKGMANAKNVILTGCSAGGLSVMHNCDSFKSLLPSTTRVKCMSDAGFFMHVNDVSGYPRYEEYIDNVVTTHGSAKNLRQSCTSKMKPSLCFFPQYFAQEIQTPLFILNSPIDMWQIQNILVPIEADPPGVWGKCIWNLTSCSDIQFQKIQDFRSQFINALDGIGKRTSTGLFINTCFKHCQTEHDNDWIGDNSPHLDNKTIAKAIGDWYFERSPFQKIGPGYDPNDKTCHD